MSDRPFFAARLEGWFNRKVEALLRLFGWHEAVVAYTGYGTASRIRVLARVVLVPPRSKGIIARDFEHFMQRRGWRNFAALPCGHVPARITVGDTVLGLTTDRQGYIDVRIRDHHLEPGWHTVGITARTSRPVQAPVQVIGDDVRFGIISDIDDTVITTFLPRLFIAAWNSFVLTEQARMPVPGMAEMYQALLADNPGAPVCYVSTGAWDTAPFLERFLSRNGYPRGALLLSDWGPTNTGWFRSGRDHKRRALRDLAKDLPRIKWVLIGDDGQHDPSIYADFAQHLHKRVRAIGIRQLSPTEQVLAHGTFDTFEAEDLELSGVKEVRAPDGFELLPLLRSVLHRKVDKQRRAKTTAAPEPERPDAVPHIEAG